MHISNKRQKPGRPNFHVIPPGCHGIEVDRLVRLQRLAEVYKLLPPTIFGFLITRDEDLDTTWNVQRMATRPDASSMEVIIVF